MWLKRCVTVVFLCCAMLSGQALAKNIVKPQSPDNSYVASVVLNNNAAGTITTFAHPFRQGDVPESMGLNASVNGQPTDLQVDVKTRWPDRSLKHAIMSVKTTQNQSDVQVDLFRSTQPVDARSQTTPLLQNLLNQQYALSLELEMPRQTLRTAVSDLLEARLQQTGTAFWLDGLLVQEVRLIKELSPEMRAIIDLRVDATGTVRTSVSVHNDVLYENENEAFTYNARILLGSASIWEQRSLRHHAYTNWREIIWSGAQPSPAVVSYDPAYLVASRLVPPYDVTLDLDGNTLQKWATPLGREAFAPFASNDVHTAMPGTGYRADLGMLPEWSVVALISQEPLALRRMQANAAAAGGIPWHFRDPKTDGPLTLDDHPKVWLEYRATKDRNGHVAPEVKSQADWRIDTAHMPDLNYLPYLLSGDRYFLDELQLQVSWSQFVATEPNNRQAAGLWASDQTRAQGWQLRSMTYAAQITPDLHPMKNYYEMAVQARLKWYIKNHVIEARYGAPKNAQIAGWVHGYTVDKPASKGGMMKPFMQDFFAMPMAYAAHLGYEDAQTYLRYMANFYAGRFTQNAFDPIQANTYAWAVVDNNERKLTTWAEVAEVNFANGTFEKGKSKLGGYAHMANAAAGSTRAGLALMASAMDDPLAAEAYAYVVSQTPIMETGRNGVAFSESPQWAIVPMFADSSVLPIDAADVGSDSKNSLSANAGNALLIGMGGDDEITGGSGSAFLIGWDGNDTIATGTGFVKVSGGRGNDTIVAQGATAHIRTGIGTDTIVLGGQPVGDVTVYDYNTEQDIIRIVKTRYDQDGTQGWLWQKNENGQYQIVFSDNSRLTLHGLGDDDLQNVRFDVVEN